MAVFLTQTWWANQGSCLIIIINTSILTGEFPSKWKIAKVIPLHKKGDKKSLKNYRPIVNLVPNFTHRGILVITGW